MCFRPPLDALPDGRLRVLGLPRRARVGVGAAAIAGPGGVLEGEAHLQVPRLLTAVAAAGLRA